MGLLSCLCHLRTNGSCTGSHRQLTNRAMLSGRLEEERWYFFACVLFPTSQWNVLLCECTESSKQHSSVLHELSIEQDVVQLRLEADWLETDYSRLFL